MASQAFAYDPVTAASEFYDLHPARRGDTYFVGVPEGAPGAEPGFAAECAKIALALPLWLSRAQGWWDACIAGQPQVWHYEKNGQRWLSAIAGEAGMVTVPAPPATSVVIVPATRLHGLPFTRYLFVEYFNKKAAGGGNDADAPGLPAPPAYQNDVWWAQAIFDHEAGHVLAAHLPLRQIVPPTLWPHVNECFADAYALARHCQRFGPDTDFPEAFIAFRARLLPHMLKRYDYAWQHMTVACTKPLAAPAVYSALAALSAAETVAAVASHVAATYLEPEQLNAIMDMNHADASGAAKWFTRAAGGIVPESIIDACRASMRVFAPPPAAKVIAASQQP